MTTIPNIIQQYITNSVDTNKDKLCSVRYYNSLKWIKFFS